MEKRIWTMVGAALVSLASGCGDGAVDPTEMNSDHSGVVNPAGAYCVALGYTATLDDCQFPDGTRCEQWSFYRGGCGQAHSFCNLHGGTISTKTEDMGSYTTVYGFCTLADGSQCKEDAFSRTSACP